MSEPSATKSQRIRFMAELWPDACAAMGWRADDRELRLEKLSEWLGRDVKSFNEVGKLKDFDIVKAECLALSRPADVNGQLRQINQPLIRLRYKCRQQMHGREAYVLEILRDRFHTTTLEDLDVSQLTQLRNTLAARENKLRRRTKQPERAEDENVPF